MENNVIITLRTNEEIKKELDKMALDENRSLNNFILTILIKYIEEQKKGSKWADFYCLLPFSSIIGSCLTFSCFVLYRLEVI